MLLSSELGVHQTIPKEYVLDVTAESVNNTFVFTEQDLPGFKSKSRQRFDLSNANMPARLTRPNIEKTKQPWDPNKRFTPYFRKAIPSEFDSLSGRWVLIIIPPERTTLAGRVVHEVNSVPVENEESRRLLAMKTKEAMKPKFFTKFVDEDLSDNRAGFIQPGTVAGMNAFGGFIVSSRDPLLSVYILIILRKPKGRPLVAGHNLAKLLVCLKTSFWIGYSSASGDITTGQ
jgi:transcription initiation factor TFIIF subunit beta